MEPTQRDRQVRAVKKALQEVGGIEVRYDPWRVKALVEKWVDELNTVETWEQIPVGANVAYDKLGGTWYRETAAGEQPIPVWRNILGEEPLCRIYGPMTNIRPPETPADEKTDELPKDLVTIIGTALGQAFVAYDMINNDKRNTAYFKAAEATCRKAIDALKKLTGGAEDGD